MLLFVYGTLMRHGSHHELIKGQKFICKAVAKGKLYELNVGFPAMTIYEQDNSEVLGEIYDIQESIIHEIDELEGYYPDDEDESLYLRRDIEVETLKKEKMKVYTYVMPERSLKRFSSEFLEGGRWL